MKFIRKFYLLVIFLLLLANFFVWKEILQPDRNFLKVIFFDIGQGDAIFIKTPQNHQILIDGGFGKKILEKLNGQMPFWDRTIDLIILSHPDSDHLGGLNYVLDRYKVDYILWTGAKRETKTFERWLEKIEREIKKEKAKVIIAQRGQKIKASWVEIYILYPFQSLEDKIFKETANKSSIVAKLSFFKNSFLFTGDIDKKIEKMLIETSSKDLKSEILKIPHHGSKYSSSFGFLKKSEAQAAIISLGRNNSYNYPHSIVLNNLRDLGMKILRTDLLGDIELISNGVKIKLKHQFEMKLPTAPKGVLKTINAKF